MAAAVDIVNQVIHVAVDQVSDSIFTIILAIATLALAIITGVGLWRTLIRTKESNEQLEQSNKELIKSNELTQESNEILKQEVKSKYRPLFKLSSPTITIRENQDQVVFCASLMNEGTVAARKIRMSHRNTNNQEIQEFIKDKDDSNMPRRLIGTIQNGGDRPIEELVECKKGIPVYHLMWFEYMVFDRRKESAVLCTLNTNEPYNIKQEWFIQEDINEARKELKDFQDGKTGV